MNALDLVIAFLQLSLLFEINCADLTFIYYVSGFMKKLMIFSISVIIDESHTN